METPDILFCTARDANGKPCTEPRMTQDPKATNRHCRVHNAMALRKHREDTLEQEHGKGYNRGVSDLREILIREFASLGAGMVTGEEAAYLIHQAPGPLPRENGNGNGIAKVEEKRDAAKV